MISKILRCSRRQLHGSLKKLQKSKKYCIFDKKWRDNIFGIVTIVGATGDNGF